MAKRIDYAALFTRRKDGRYQKKLTINGETTILYDRDPEALFRRVQEAEKPKPVLFQKMAEEWQTEHAAKVEYKTSEAYIAPTRRIVERFGEEQYCDVTPAKIQAYMIYLSNQDYAKRTVQMHLDILRMIGNYAIVKGVAETNPVQAVSLPSGLHSGKRDIPTDAEIEIVKTHPDASFGLFAFFLYYSGLRKGEALALNYEDIDFQNRTISVNKAITFKGNTPSIKSTKTTAGNRSVILLDILAERLDPNGHGLVFHDDGKPLTKMQFRKRWEKYCREVGLVKTTQEKHKSADGMREYTKNIHEPTIGPHQLRHAFATVLYDAEIDEKAAQEMLGHASITTTKNVYTHIRQSKKKDTADKLNAYIENQRVSGRVSDA